MSQPEVVAIAFPAEAFEGAEGVGLNDYTSRVGVTCPTELIRLADHERLQAETERLQAARAADKARIAELVEALESMTCAYRMAIQAGHARITALGGDCDSVDRMLADFPDYGRSVELYKSCSAALAQQGKENADG